MRRFLVLGIVVALLIALWTGGWFYAAGELRRTVLALAENDGEAAPQLRCGTLDVTGYPFRFDLACTEAQLVDRDLTLRLAGLRASVRVYDLTHAVVSGLGPLGVADAFSGSQSRLDFARLDGSVRLVARDLGEGLGGRGWRIGRVSIVGDDLRWTDTVAGDRVLGTTTHAEFHLVDIPARHDRARGSAALAAFLTAADLDAPGLAVADAELSLEAELSGLPDDLLALAEAPEPLRDWQARGGALRIAKLVATQPSPDTLLDATGTASLTADGFANAEVTYRTRGVFERFEALLPPWQFIPLRGAAEDDGTYLGQIRMENGAIRLLTFTLVETPPLF